MMARNPKEFDPRKYLEVSTDAMRDICIARYRSVWRLWPNRQDRSR